MRVIMDGIFTTVIARLARSWSIHSAFFPAARQRNPFVHTRLLERPVAKLTPKVRMNFRVLFYLGGYSKDLAAPL
jgi:hypothetical protein